MLIAQLPVQIVTEVFSLIIYCITNLGFVAEVVPHVRAFKAAYEFQPRVAVVDVKVSHVVCNVSESRPGNEWSECITGENCI